VGSNDNAAKNTIVVAFPVNMHALSIFFFALAKVHMQIY
jgi:hypothetical protein